MLKTARVPATEATIIPPCVKPPFAGAAAGLLVAEAARMDDVAELVVGCGVELDEAEASVTVLVNDALCESDEVDELDVVVDEDVEVSRVGELDEGLLVVDVELALDAVEVTVVVEELTSSLSVVCSREIDDDVLSVDGRWLVLCDSELDSVVVGLGLERLDRVVVVRSSSSVRTNLGCGVGVAVGS